jgi:hypothetical protein
MQAVIQREKREEMILSSLEKLDYLSRSQLQRIHRLKGDRNARKVLQDMKEYVSSFKDGENIYYLNREGRERVGCKKIRKKTLQARHYLMRNELYIALNQPFTWENEMFIENIGIIADAMYINGGKHTFIEVDHLQKMSKNRLKIQKYRKLSNFDLIWITTTEHRRKRLEKLCEGISTRAFTIEELR